MSYFRECIRDLEEYTPGFQPREKGFIKLNTNENPYPPSSRVLEYFKKASGQTLRLYPDPLSDDLRDQIGKIYGFKRDWIMIGNGSDELINLVMRAVLEKNDKVFLTNPTYALYEVLAKVQEARIVSCVLDDHFDLPEEINLKNEKLLMFSNPNTPTGKIFEKEKLRKICTKAKGIVFIDEAYADFSKENCMDFVKKFKNVIIARTLSKSFSLAGLRLGFLLAQPETIKILMKLKDSYNVSQIGQLLAIEALKDLATMKKAAKMIIRDREFLAKNLDAIGFEVCESQSNFIFVKHSKNNAKTLYEELFKRKILVRYFNVPRLKDYLRISIGTHQDMVKLIQSIKEILKIRG